MCLNLQQLIFCILAFFFFLRTGEEGRRRVKGQVNPALIRHCRHQKSTVWPRHTTSKQEEGERHKNGEEHLCWSFSRHAAAFSYEAVRRLRADGFSGWAAPNACCIQVELHLMTLDCHISQHHIQKVSWLNADACLQSNEMAKFKGGAEHGGRRH